MHVGGAVFFTAETMHPADLARALEERGFESVWAPEHSHIPVVRSAPFPGTGEMPREYAEAMDPFVSLTACAAATSRLKIGAGVCLVIQRDTIQTAKQVASIDQVSGGRFLFGVGGGWNTEEMLNHGVDLGTRFKKMREQIAAMRTIWAEETAAFSGDIVRFPPMKAWPKPVQKPGPPVILGGAFPQGARRAVAYGDGWIPHASRADYADIGDVLPQFAAMVREAARHPASVPVTVFRPPPDLGLLQRYADLGVSRVVATVPSAGRDAVLPVLDQWAKLIQHL